MLGSFSVVAEMVAGQTYFRNFWSFMTAGRVPAMLGVPGFTLEQDRIAGADLVLRLLRLSITSGKP